MRRFPPVACTLLCLSLWLLALAGAASGASSFTVRSTRGDDVGFGRTYPRYTDANATFRVRYNERAVVAECEDSRTSWSLEFAGPFGGPLQAGTYENAVVDYYSSDAPRLQVTSNLGRPYTGHGRFTVRKIIYGAEGQVSSFWVVFEQHSGSNPPALRGELKFDVDSTAAPVNQGPRAKATVKAQRVVMPGAAELVGAVADDGQPAGRPLITTWSQFAGPGAATFANASALQTTATFSAPGWYDLMLTVSDGEFETTDRVGVLAIDTSIDTMLTIQSELGEIYGEGRTRTFTPVESDIGLYNPNPGTIKFTCHHPKAQWTIGLAVPSNEPLKVGVYAFTQGLDEVRIGPHALGFRARPSYSTEYPVHGAFTIKKIVFDAAGKVISLWATFEQYIDGVPKALRGEIKFNAGETAANINQPPIVLSQSPRVAWPKTLALSANAHDDGFPNGALTVHWSFLGGAGTASFSAPDQPETIATFSHPGFYSLQLAVSDGEHTVTRPVHVMAVDGSAAHSIEAHADAPKAEHKSWDQRYYDTFTATESAGVITIKADGFYDDYTVRFAAPAGQTLARGLYQGASDLEPRPAGAPFLDVPYLSRQHAAGSFEVLKLERDAEGKLVSFCASFVQHGAMGGLLRHGQVRFNPNYSPGGPNQAPAVSAGLEATVTLGTPCPLYGAVEDVDLPGGAITAQWKKVAGPGAVTFADAGALRTTASFTLPGKYILELSANDGELAGAARLHVEVIGSRGPTILREWSDPGDPIGGGLLYSYDPVNSAFHASVDSQNAVRVSLFGPDTFTHYVSLVFAAANGAPLRPGVYENTIQPEANAPERPKMIVTGSQWLEGEATGRFEVKQIEIGPGGWVRKLWITFDQLADGATGQLHGELRWHADAPLTPITPVVNAGPDFRATAAQPAPLAGTVLQDGSPATTEAATRWTVVSGPGPVAFADAASPSTTATFGALGTYMLRLAATTSAETVSDDLVVTATLAEGPLAGFRLGAAVSADGAPAGDLQLSFTAAGSFTGTLLLEGYRYSLRGLLAEEGTWSETLNPASPAPVKMTLQRDAAGLATFSLEQHGKTYAGGLTRFTPPSAGTYPPEYPGLYNCWFAPGGPIDGVVFGSGWGSLQVDPNGRAWIFGRSPDGTPFVYHTVASAEGRVYVYSLARQGRSVLAGLLQCAAAPDIEIGGTLHWSSRWPATRKTPARSFAASLPVIGTALPARSRGQEPFRGYSISQVPLMLTFSGLRFGPFTMGMLLSGEGAVLSGEGNTTGRLKVDRFGYFSGTFRDPLTRKMVPFDGVISPALEAGQGLFRAPGQAGTVEMVPTDR